MPLWTQCIKKKQTKKPPQQTLSSFDWKLKLLTGHYKKTQTKTPTTVPKRCSVSRCQQHQQIFFSFHYFYVLYFGAPFNTRLRGNTESSVVDTGVSLSTHTSPISSTPLGRLISYRARKWEEGQCSRRAWSDDVTAGNKDSDCCR